LVVDFHSRRLVGVAGAMSGAGDDLEAIRQKRMAELSAQYGVRHRRRCHRLVASP
jgi:hypothetical protein